MERNEECRITHNGVVSESVWRETTKAFTVSLCFAGDSCGDENCTCK